MFDRLPYLSNVCVSATLRVLTADRSGAISVVLLVLGRPESHEISAV